jgi:5-methylcytosine-specific restriction endonuclease McrA
MQAHTKIYLRYFGYGEQDFVPCESCGKRATEIHHLVFKSHGGQNNIENLCAICRTCHNKAHENKEFNNKLKAIHMNKYRAWEGSTGKKQKP